MKDESRFWDRIAEKYYRTPIKDPDAYEEKLSMSRGYLDPDNIVLEFGCGTGGTALKHAPFVKHIDAIDISENMLSYARNQANHQGVSNVTFKKASIESYVAPDCSYDVIFGMSILHLVGDRDAVLKRVIQLLKPGGVFISSTICLADTIKIFKYIAPVGKALGVFPTVKVFSKDELENELEAQGFSVQRTWRPSKKMAAFVVAEKESIHYSSDATPASDQSLGTQSRQTQSISGFKAG